MITGEHVVLACEGRPVSLPAANIEWQRSRGSARYIVEPNERIFIDANGTLCPVHIDICVYLKIYQLLI